MVQRAGSCQYGIVSFAEIDSVKLILQFFQQIAEPQPSAFQNIHLEIVNLWLSKFPLGKPSPD